MSVVFARSFAILLIFVSATLTPADCLISWKITPLEARRMKRYAFTAFVAFTFCTTAGAADDRAGNDFFEAKIRPVLVAQCAKCHDAAAETAKKLKGGLRLDTRDALLKGGDTGAAIMPGKPDQGTLLKALKYDGDLQMPPSGKLPAATIADFEKWIAMGAPDPRDGSTTTTSGIDLVKGKQFWAFQLPRSPSIPVIEKPKVPVRNPIDAFVQKAWDDKQLLPAGIADKRTLIRRAYFDLIGLPPTIDEVTAFEKDNNPDAFAKVLDHLLASPHYGERWARHWLDVARYSEDQAHTFQVKPKENAYRYRDWVIRAFNADMPYDQFVRLQIAGDLVGESEGDLFTRIAGLGFLGLGAEYYKNTFREQAVADELDDRVDTLTRGFMGITVSCARCHDHKFDPIPTRDYYSIAGIFNGSNLAESPLVSPLEVKKYADGQQFVKAHDDKIKAWLTERSAKVAEAEVHNTALYLVQSRKIQTAQGTATKPDLEKIAKDASLDVRVLKQWLKYIDPKNAKKVVPELKAWFAIKPDATNEETATLATAFEKALQAAVADRSKPKKENEALIKAIFLEPNGPFAVPAADVEKQLAPDDSKTLVAMRAKLQEIKKSAPLMYPAANVLQGGGTTMKVFVRGNPLKFGEVAPKGFLQLFTSPISTTTKDYSRLDLANAIASKDNPLTARVIVNRVWQQHFGKGLVGTPSNFGKLGDRPTHPELLDWLTLNFIERGWSIKMLHRTIMLSSTYQLKSSTTAAGIATDGDNAMLWRANRRRMDVEIWRDSLLAVSGNLDRTAGGPTFDLKSDANRRTVYAKISRHELDGLLRLFDFPDANVTADKRTVTTVPQQQLFALNSEFMLKQAKSFAARLQRLSNDAERIRAGYQQAYGRLPTDKERSLGERYLATKPTAEDKLSRLEQYAQILLASNEFLYID